MSLEKPETFFDMLWIFSNCKTKSLEEDSQFGDSLPLFEMYKGRLSMESLLLQGSIRVIIVSTLPIVYFPFSYVTLSMAYQ